LSKTSEIGKTLRINEISRICEAFGIRKTFVTTEIKETHPTNEIGGTLGTIEYVKRLKQR